MSDFEALLVMHVVVQVVVGAAYIVACVVLLACRALESLATDALAGLDLWRRRMSRRQFLSARRARNQARAASHARQGKGLQHEQRYVRVGTHVAHRPGIAG